jgi:aryl-alcohol dehydrogenase-like predicted oxidoreductase
VEKIAMSPFLRPLGEAGPLVSALALGTVKIGRNQGVKYPTRFELPSDGEVSRLLGLARELGINLLDTAPAYGSSMARLGSLLPGNRHDWIIVSKVGERFIDGRSHFDFSQRATMRDVEESLRLLGRDYLDAVLIHSDGDDQRILGQEGVVDALEQLKEQGKIRAHGISGKSVEGGLLALERLDLVMVTCNLGYDGELAVMGRAAQLGKGVLIKKAFDSGHGVSKGVEQSLRHVYAQPGVSSIIVGTVNPEHLRENVEIARRILEEDPPH